MVTTLNGSAAVPVPVGVVWLTKVHGVKRDVAFPPAGTNAGPYSVPVGAPTATNVPHAVLP